MSEEAETPKNSRNIPTAPFFTDVAARLREQNCSIEQLYDEMADLYGRYKFMESNLVGEQKHYLEKQPTLSDALEALDHVIAKRDEGESISTLFQAEGPVYMKAKIPPVEKVALWIGAKVMLEYDVVEARDFLTTQLEGVREQLSSIAIDLSFLKKQLTTMEVSLARIHNYRVEMRQQNQKQVKA